MKHSQRGAHRNLNNRPITDINNNNISFFYDIDAVFLIDDISKLKESINTNLFLKPSISKPKVKNFIHRKTNIEKLKSLKLGYILTRNSIELSIFLLSRQQISIEKIEKLLNQMFMQKTLESRLMHKDLFGNRKRKAYLVLHSKIDLIVEEIKKITKYKIWFFIEGFGTKKEFFGLEMVNINSILNTYFNMNNVDLIVDFCYNVMPNEPNRIVFPTDSFLYKLGLYPNYYQFMSFLFPCLSYYSKKYRIDSVTHLIYGIQKYNFYSNIQDTFDNIIHYYPKCTKKILENIISNSKNPIDFYDKIIDNWHEALVSNSSFAYRLEFRFPFRLHEIFINDLNFYIEKNSFNIFEASQILDTTILNYNLIISEMKKIENYMDVSYSLNLENLLIPNILKGSFYKLPFSNAFSRTIYRDLYADLPYRLDLDTIRKLKSKTLFNNVFFDFINTIKNLKKETMDLILKMCDINEHIFDFSYVKKILQDEIKTTDPVIESIVYYNPDDFLKNIYIKSKKTSLFTINLINIVNDIYNDPLKDLLIVDNQFIWKEEKILVKFNNQILFKAVRDDLLEKCFTFLNNHNFTNERWTENEKNELTYALKIYNNSTTELRKNMFFGFNIKRTVSSIKSKCTKYKTRELKNFEPLTWEERLKILEDIMHLEGYDEFIANYRILVEDGRKVLNF